MLKVKEEAKGEQQAPLKKTNNNQQPTTNNQQPTTNNQQPTTNNQRTDISSIIN
jgi:hypothetical protein